MFLYISGDVFEVIIFLQDHLAVKQFLLSFVAIFNHAIDNSQEANIRVAAGFSSLKLCPYD